jgi:predicted nucleic acid-binding protein
MAHPDDSGVRLRHPSTGRKIRRRLYYTDVPRTQHDCPDPEDNLILDLAAFTDADLIVTNDSDLLQLGRVHGGKGRPVIDPNRFTALADGAARHSENL